MTNSSCCNALPNQSNLEDRVIIYYFDRGWVPIKYCTLGKAVALQRQVSDSGQEMFIFPVEAAPARLPSLIRPVASRHANES